MVNSRLMQVLMAISIVSVSFSTSIANTGADAHFQEGVNYINKGDYKEAIEEFNKTLNIDPKYIDAYCGIGIAYINQKKYKEAIEALERAISLDSEKAIAYYLLGMAYEQIMSYGKAITAWNKFLALSPEGKSAERVKRHLQRLEEFEE